MSRHPLPDTSESERSSKATDEYINFVAEHAVPKAMTLEQVKRETHIDMTLQEVVRRIQLGNWDDPSDFPVMQSFRNVQDELSALDDLILRGTRLVLPEALQEAAINIADEGHIRDP